MSTVLVVDDQAELRQLFQRVLESQGYQIVCATNGQAGLAMLDRANPQLILLDMAMPQMDGITFPARSCAQKPKFQTVPVIVLSGLMSREQIQAARDLGVTDHLVKAEFTMKELLQTAWLSPASPANGWTSGLKPARNQSSSERFRPMKRG